MAKTLNQFLEGYLKVKNPDEQKFVDKHVVAKHSDRNGNDDEVFKGTKVKPIDRRKDRHGYNPGEDEKVYEELKGNQHKIDANKNGKIDAEDFKHLRKKKMKEEAEQIDELSTPTLQSYRKKARAQGNAIVDKMKMGGGDWSKDQKDTKTLRKRAAGAQASGKQLVKRGESLKTEEAEQIDELSKKTLATYAIKAKDQMGRDEARAGYQRGIRTMDGKGQGEMERAHDRRAEKRSKGIDNALNRLAKEEVQIDEISKGKAMKALQHVASDPDDTRGYTLRKKIGKKWPEMKSHAADAAHVASYGRSKDPVAALSRDKLADRAKTSYRMTKDGKANKQDLKARFRKEETELEEKLNMDKASMGDVIKDFRDSNAPQFKGKSKEKRRAMAIAAKLTAERGGKPLRKEEKLADLLGDLTESHRRTMLSVFDKLNESNQKKFLEACETPEGVESMLDFSISHRGE